MNLASKLGLVVTIGGVLFVAKPVRAATFTWAGGTSNWDDTSATGWNTEDGYPQAIDDVATYSGVGNAVTTLNVSGVTLGSLATTATTVLPAMNGHNAWTIDGTANPLTFQVSSGSATISAVSADATAATSLTVLPAINLLSNLVVSTSTAAADYGAAPAPVPAAINLNGAITGTGDVTLSANNSATNATGARTASITVASLNNAGTLTVNGSNGPTAAGAPSTTIITSIGSAVTALSKSGTGSLSINGGTLNAVVSGAADQTIRKSITAATLTVSGDNSATYHGLWVAGSAGSGDRGMLVFNSLNAIGSSGAKIAISNGGVAVAGYAIDQSFIDRISLAAVNGQAISANGVIALGVNSSNNLNVTLPGVNNVSLGAADGSAVTFSGTLTNTTEATTTFKLGGRGHLIIDKPNAMTNYAGTATRTRGINVGAVNAANSDPNNTSIVEITAAQSFTGVVNIDSGTLRTTLIADAGQASGIGQGPVTATSLVFQADTASRPAILEYTGTGGSTNRLFQLGRTGMAKILNNGASGSLSFTATGSIGNMASSGTGSILALGGSNTADNTLAVRLIDSTHASTPKMLSVTKEGVGKWIFTNANTYTAGTTITGGTLLINNSTGSGTGTGVVAVEATGTLGGTGRITPSGANGITVANNASVAPGGSASPGTLTFDLGGTSGVATMSTGSTFKFDLGTAGDTFATPGISDQLAIAGADVNDVVFNNNVLDLQGTGQLGVYKLFDSSLATAVEGADTWSGLTLGANREIISGLSAINLPNEMAGTLFVGNGVAGDAGDIYLVVPEPATLGFVPLLSLLMLRRRRHVI